MGSGGACFGSGGACVGSGGACVGSGRTCGVKKGMWGQEGHV